MAALTCPHCHHPFPAGRKLRLLGTPAPLRCQHCQRLMRVRQLPSLLLRGSLWALWALSMWWFDRNLPLILGLGLLAWVVETLVNIFLIPMEALPPATDNPSP